VSDKVKIDILSQDESLGRQHQPPDPDIIAAEIVEDPRSRLRLPSRQPQRARMGNRPIPSQHRQTQRITNGPNREDEPDYIVKPIAQVITVSLETQTLIAALPPLETG
jgi:hypothetical protein